MSPRTTAIALLIVLSGCPKSVPPSAGGSALSAADSQLTREVAALGIEALALVREQDEQLWAHWTQGARLDLDKPALSHSVLFDEPTLGKIRIARSKGLGDSVGLLRLESWLVGERLARATAEANASLAGLEAAATFNLDGKPIAWRDLTRLLAHEKSALKRRALWAASREVVPALAAATQQRDQAVELALRALGTTAAAYAGISSDESAALGKKFLDDTEVQWKQTLELLSKTELGLPADKLTRAGLPRLLRPSTAADASFLKADQAAKATALLGALGLYGLSGLTLDLADSAKKNPLPLTVAPTGAEDVRVSFRPAGGARDASALLAELGRALAIHETVEPPQALARLTGPRMPDASARLFSDLASNLGWLKSQGASNDAAASTILSAQALRLFTLRRAAGNLVAQHEARGMSDEAAAQSWQTWSVRALSVEASPEDATRWPLERDPLFRGVELLRAMLGAQQLRQKLSEQWWATSASTVILRAAWNEPEKKAPTNSGRAFPSDAGRTLTPDAGRSLTRPSPDAGG